MDHQEEDCGYDGGDNEKQSTEVCSLYERRTSLPQAIQIDFSKANMSTSIYSSTYELDDEVFIEFEEWQSNTSFTQNQMMSGCEDSRRQRRASERESRRAVEDVIDSVGGDLWPYNYDFTNKPRRLTSPDIRDTVQCFDNRSPSTPKSEGYYSSSVSSPLEPKWFRFSQSSEYGQRRSTTGEEDSTPSMSIRAADMVDSKISENSLQPPTTPVRRDFEVKETPAPVSKDSYEYNMSHSKRGVAVIFNHEKFRTPTLPPRPGSEHDVKSLWILYHEILGFEVRVYNDYNCQQIYDTLRDLSQEDHKDNDCVCINVLTHGLDGEHLYAYDNPYAYNDLYNMFSASQCLSLAGKPKIFIFQACRGRMLDAGVRMLSCQTATDSAPSSSYTIPNMADFLIANSTFEGFYSWRNPEEGTWYIQSLVSVIKEQHEQVDLLTMMTRAACTVATDYESTNERRPDLSGMKQAPSLVSTLIRQIYFRSKT